MAIQIKRTSEAVRKESDVILASGQPLYDVDTKKLYISDGVTATKLLEGTEIGLPLESGEGENSLQLLQSAESFTYKSSGTDYTYETATTGKDALNLSSLGRITRNGYAIVGNCNTVEYDANNKLDEDDGGIIAGYKNYTNTRGSSLFGAHNRLLDTKNSFILGYQNTLYGDAGDGSSSSLIVGGANYMQSSTRHSCMIGYGLKNNTAHPFQYHFGTWNDQGNQKDRLRFTIGNGTTNWIYQDVQLGTPDTRPKPTLQDCISINEKLKYNPNKEGWRYIKVGNSYQLITSTTSQTDFDNSLVYQYKNAGRSNAFQVSTDGRAQLIRQKIAQYGEDGLITDVVDYTPLGDTDLLTKNEIEAKDSAVLSEATGYTDNIANTLQSDITQLSSTKANKATTLSGYGITDAYTETQIDDKFTGLTTTKIIDGDERIKSITQTNGLLSVTTEKDCKNVSSVADITQLLNNSRAHYLIAFGAQLTLGNVIIPNYSKGYLYSTGTDAMISVVAPTGVIYNVYYNSSNNTFSGRRCLSAECTWTSGTTSVLTLEADELYILDYYGKSFIIDTNKAIGEAVYSYIAWNSESSTSHELTLYTFELDANLKLRLYKEGITSLSPSSTPSRNELNETILYKKL